MNSLVIHFSDMRTFVMNNKLSHKEVQLHHYLLICCREHVGMLGECMMMKT